MEAYQERVVVEATELNEKIEKIQSFMDSSVFQSHTPEAEQIRMGQQFLAMTLYHSILRQRIDAF